MEAQAIERLREKHEFTGSSSAVHRYVRFLEGGGGPAFPRIEVEPGEEAQVDFGYAGLMFGPKAGKERKTWVFGMTLSHSRHQYACLVFDQTVGTWLRCHCEAFEYLGGVPKRVVYEPSGSDREGGRRRAHRAEKLPRARRALEKW